MDLLSRRLFFKISGITAVVAAIESFSRRGALAGDLPLGHAAVSASRLQRAKPRRLPANTAQEIQYLFFDSDDAVFMEAALERLIPTDEHGPGALQNGVLIFIDRQLAGAWGAGERLYRNGPWQPSAPSTRYQLPHTPAELFRCALRGIEIDLGQRPQPPSAGLAGFHSAPRTGVMMVSTSATFSVPVSARRDFARLPVSDQDAYLKSLQAGGKDLAGVPSQVFFESLLGLTIEGFFSDPVHGGEEDMVAWIFGYPDLKTGIGTI